MLVEDEEGNVGELINPRRGYRQQGRAQGQILHLLFSARFVLLLSTVDTTSEFTHLRFQYLTLTVIDTFSIKNINILLFHLMLCDQGAFHISEYICV